MALLPPVIETKRMILRPFTLDDIPASHLMNLDAEVSQYTGDGGVVSLHEIERRIKENVLGDYKKYGYGRLAVEEKGGENFIGFCGLKYIPEDKEVDLGYRFMKKYWGKGLATEASKACLDYGFNTLKLKRVTATVLPDNHASINVLRKLGFTFEKEIIEDGELVLFYALVHPIKPYIIG